MNIIHRGISFLNYLWQAKTIFYIHSPFVYRFYKTILSHQNTTEISAISILRKQKAIDNTFLFIQDFGTGLNQQKPVKTLVNEVAIRPKYGQVLYQLVAEFKPKSIIEIGTSIGISSSYLAKGNPAATVYCLEGSNEPIQFAQALHKELSLNNIEYKLGDFSETLPLLISSLQQVDFIFFDGNHTKQATINYFEQCVAKTTTNSIFVFDDIYWSEEMTEAWEIIKADKRVKLTIDIYQLGICFFKEDKIAKENFKLLY